MDLKQEFSRLAGEHGAVAWKDLTKLAKACGIETSARRIVQIQGELRVDNGDDIVEEGIFWDQWAVWYKRETQDQQFSHHNELLVRPALQSVKHPTRDLKPNCFHYGQRNIPDPEGSGEVVLNWVSGKKSKDKDQGISMLKVNKAAVKEKKTTAKEVCKFLRDNKTQPALQRPKIVGKKKSHRFSPQVDEQESKKDDKTIERHNSTFQQIIFPGTNDDSGCNEHFMNKSGATRKGRLPKPRPTQSSTALKAHTALMKEKNQPQVQWKMKKFSGASAKIKMG